MNTVKVRILRPFKNDKYSVSNEQIDELIRNTELPIPLDRPEFGGYGSNFRPIAIGWVTKLGKDEAGYCVATIEVKDAELWVDAAAVVPAILQDPVTPRIVCVSQTVAPMFEIEPLKLPA